MAKRRTARTGWLDRLLSWQPLLITVALGGSVGCVPYGDGAADMRAHRKAMRATTAEYERGTALVGQALVDALSGRTLVFRSRISVGGRETDSVVYRYFGPGGRFVYFDNNLRNVGFSFKYQEGDYWKVTGPRLCTLSQLRSSVPNCYVVARTTDGTIQFYVDDPGGPYHDLLTAMTREIIEGPPRFVHQVPAHRLCARMSIDVLQQKLPGLLGRGLRL
jgi:hypothetical protein